MASGQSSSQEKSLQEERAEYGQKIVATVSRQLALDYGKGFSEKSLRRMMQFAEVFPDEQIILSLTRQLTWTHFMVTDPHQRYYQEGFLCRNVSDRKMERTDTCENKIDSMLFERTALSKRPELVAQAELDALLDILQRLKSLDSGFKQR